MGNWKLELGKMAIYMAFPVTSFYVYHQVDWFEDKIADMHRKVRSKESIQNKKELQDCVDMMRRTWWEMTSATVQLSLPRLSSIQCWLVAQRMDGV